MCLIFFQINITKQYTKNIKYFKKKHYTYVHSRSLVYCAFLDSISKRNIDSLLDEPRVRGIFCREMNPQVYIKQNGKQINNIVVLTFGFVPQDIMH